MNFLSGPVTLKMIPTPHQVITTHSNSSEGKGAPWTEREMPSLWLSWSEQMGPATILPSPGAKERWQSCRLVLDLISTKRFVDVFVSLTRMVIYLQPFFSQHNILQTSVTHIRGASGGRRHFRECCDELHGPLSPGCSLRGPVRHTERPVTAKHTRTDPGTNVAANTWRQIYLHN